MSPRWVAAAFHSAVADIEGKRRPAVLAHRVEPVMDFLYRGADIRRVARCVAAAGKTFRRGILFVWFAGEEQGLLGSREYVKRHRTEMDKISAVFNHDTGTNWAQSLAVTEKMHAQLEPVFAQVTRLMNDFKLRQSMVQAAKTYVDQQNSYRIFADRINAVYGSL